MKTYSLLQKSLDQRISREMLEQASLAVPSVARADCAGISRNLFGIVVSNLPHADALAFQRQLAGRDFPTDVVEDAALPKLPEPFTVRRITIGGETLTFVDAMGRPQTRPRTELVFAGGGFVGDMEIRTERTFRPIVSGRGSRGAPGSGFGTERRALDKKVVRFHLDFFFWSAPHRLRAVLSEESAVFFQDRPLRWRDPPLILAAMAELRDLLPPERLTNGLMRDDTAEYYPTPMSYEEEVRWRFHHLIPTG
jgi:hypothetical protein